MAPREVIHESPGLIVVRQDAATDIVFVVFNGFGFNINGDRFSEDNFFAKLGVAALGVVTAEPDWYPEAKMLPALAAIRAAAGSRRIVTFGHGHGGYGALKYAAALDAFATVAFSPQWSIDPGEVGDFDRRFSRYFNPDLRNGGKILSDQLGPANYIVFDPYEDIDRQHVGRIKSTGGDRVLAVLAPFARDRTLRMLTGCDRASELTAMFSAPRPPPAAELRRVLRAARRGFEPYFVNRLDAVIRERPHKVSLIERLSETLPPSERLLLLMRALVSASRAEDALRILRDTPEDILVAAGVPALAALFRDAKFLQGEAFLIPLMQKQHEGNLVEFLKTVDIYLRMEDFLAARDTMRTALAFPDSAAQMNEFMQLAVRLRNDEICGAVSEMILTNPALDLRERVKIGTGYAADCYRFGARQVSVRCLRRLWELAGDNEIELDLIVKGLMRINEFSMALGIRSRLANHEPDNLIKKLAAIDLLCRTDREIAVTQLAEVLLRPQNTPEFWNLVSECKRRLDDLPGAIDATLRALAAGADEVTARRRLVTLHWNKQDFPAVRSELKKILALPDVPAEELRQLAGTAASIGDKKLALACATRQYEGEENNPHAYLHLIHALIDVEEGAAAAKLLTEAVDGTRPFGQLSPHLWLSFVTEASRLGRIDLERQFIEDALKKYPGDRNLMDKRDEVSARLKVLGWDIKNQCAPPVKPKSRLARIFRLS